jgi:type IV pilus biogenesis protein CpaD/CtpE
MRITVLIVAGVVTVAGCADTQAPLNAGFGDAYDRNIAVQVIDPTPTNAGSGAPDFEGERARIAIDRYRGATTLVPETTTTSEVSE